MAQNIYNYFFEYDLSKISRLYLCAGKFPGSYYIYIVQSKKTQGYMELCGTDYSGADVSDLQFFNQRYIHCFVYSKYYRCFFIYHSYDSMLFVT